jgi:HK97 gp10 family phage protein
MPDNFVEAKIEGLDQIAANLHALGDDIERRILRKAVQAGINVMAEEVLARTPTDTGLLKQSIQTTVKVEKEGGAAIGAVGFGWQSHIARWIEFGHRIVGHKPNKKDTGKHVPARPFMRPGFDASKNKAVEAFTETMREEIEKAASKSAKKVAA